MAVGMVRNGRNGWNGGMAGMVGMAECPEWSEWSGMVGMAEWPEWSRDTSTPGDLWESQIPMTCSFNPTSIPLGIPLRSYGGITSVGSLSGVNVDTWIGDHRERPAFEISVDHSLKLMISKNWKTTTSFVR